MSNGKYLHKEKNMKMKAGRLMVSHVMYSEVKGEELEYCSIAGKRDLEAGSVLWPKSKFVEAASTTKSLTTIEKITLFLSVISSSAL